VLVDLGLVFSDPVPMADDRSPDIMVSAEEGVVGWLATA